MPLKPKAKKFEEWYFGSFVCSRVSSSLLISSENKTVQSKFRRIFEVARLILENPKTSWQELRKQVAIDYFVSMRCALDYLGYAKMVIDEWAKNGHV